MENTTNKKGKDKKPKYTKEELKAQAMDGMAIGFQLVEDWKKKLHATLVIRILLGGLVVWAIYALMKMNGWI